MAAITGTALVLVEGCTGGGDRSHGNKPDPFVGVSGPVVVAVGDIACAPRWSSCPDAATARLATQQQPRYVFALGDLQYEHGRLADFRKSYADTWGRLKSITKPVPGNHEYHISGASGYFSYLRDRTRSPGYYAFDVDDWRVYALNSNCADIDCAKEAVWLDRDMTRHPRRCSAIFMHHPLYSSGEEHGDSPEGRRFWRVAVKHHADLALAAHDHDYERFQRMDADGNRTTTGLRSFVAGTGGAGLYDKGRLRKGSVVFYNRRHGVLVLKLGVDDYAWKFKNIKGSTIDSGRADCRP